MIPRHRHASNKKVLTILGTRPEVIKLAPIIRWLRGALDPVRTVTVASGQHRELLYPLMSFFKIQSDYDLEIMEPAQTPSRVCARVLSSLETVLNREKPRLILVQGDTTTAMTGALAGFYGGIPVAHVEAGLRSGDPRSPFPEEMNRRLITRLATYHFAPTARNRETLLSEGTPKDKVFVTGNPGLESLGTVLKRKSVSRPMNRLFELTKDHRRIVLTTHRRENFGERMTRNLKIVRDFVERHEETVLIFPVHPNPSVLKSVPRFAGHPRIYLLDPLDYKDFVALLQRAWLIVSDSGGIQEEVATLKKPMLILRDNTERPEVIEAGLARLVGRHPNCLAAALEEAYSAVPGWMEGIREVRNPFGEGDSGRRIARIIASILESAAGAS